MSRAARGPVFGRRALLQHTAALAGTAVISACIGTAPASKRIPIVGFFPHDLARNVEQRAAFLSELRAFGYEDGSSIKVEWRNEPDNDEGASRSAAELVALSVDVLVANGPAAQRAAKHATSTIPVVILGTDPVEAGIVESLARPGGNITGVARRSAALTAKRLDLLKEAAPGISRVAVVADGDAARGLQFSSAEAAARALGLEVVLLEVRDPADLRPALDMATSRAADALLFLGAAGADPRDDTTVLAYAATRRIPACYGNTRWVDAGGLLTYGNNGAEIFRRAGHYVARILGGTKPAEMPMEQPTKFDLVINLKTAREQGLTIPQSVLVRATRVIE